MSVPQIELSAKFVLNYMYSLVYKVKQLSFHITVWNFHNLTIDISPIDPSPFFRIETHTVGNRESVTILMKLTQV